MKIRNKTPSTRLKKKPKIKKNKKKTVVLIQRKFFNINANITIRNLNTKKLTKN